MKNITLRVISSHHHIFLQNINEVTSISTPTIQFLWKPQKHYVCPVVSSPSFGAIGGDRPHRPRACCTARWFRGLWFLPALSPLRRQGRTWGRLPLATALLGPSGRSLFLLLFSNLCGDLVIHLLIFSPEKQLCQRFRNRNSVILWMPLDCRRKLVGHGHWENMLYQHRKDPWPLGIETYTLLLWGEPPPGSPVGVSLYFILPSANMANVSGPFLRNLCFQGASRERKENNFLRITSNNTAVEGFVQWCSMGLSAERKRTQT